MRKRLERTPRRVREDAHHFVELRQTIEAGARPEVDAGALKMFGFLFKGGCDALISSEGFFVRFTWNPGPHEYFSSLTPTIVGQLLHWAGVRAPTTRICAAPLAPHGLKLLDPAASRSDVRRLLWFADDRAVIRFAIRADSEDLRGLAWPPNIELRSRNAFKELDPPRPCPYCAASLSRVRDLGDAMICVSCGRSFRSWHPSAPNPRRPVG